MNFLTSLTNNLINLLDVLIIDYLDFEHSFHRTGSRRAAKLTKQTSSQLLFDFGVQEEYKFKIVVIELKK